MKPNEMVVWTLAGIGVVTLLYMASQQTQSKIVPGTQSDESMVGLGLQASTAVMSNGTNLDMDWEIHGWHPGLDPNPHAVPVTLSKHRYPAVPGGNISTVMHKGWSSLINDAPAGNDWRIAPPEAAVL